MAQSPVAEDYFSVDADRDRRIGTLERSVRELQFGTGSLLGAPAGGVLTGTYPDPMFANDMATQEELDTAVTKIPDSSDRNVIQPTDPEFVPLVVKNAPLQVEPLQEWQDSAGDTMAKVNASGEGVFPRVAIGVPDPFPYAHLSVSPVVQDHAQAEWYAISAFPNWQPTNNVAKPFYGIDFGLNIYDNLATGNFTTSHLVGGRFRALTRNATRSISNAVGGRFAVDHLGNGGVYGNISSTRGIQVQLSTGGGTISDARMIHVQSATGAGSVTNMYGVYIDAVTKGSSLNYAIYSAGGANYLAGPTHAAGGLRVGTAATAGDVLSADSQGNGTWRSPLGQLALIEAWGHSYPGAGLLAREQLGYVDRLGYLFGAGRVDNRSIPGAVSCWPTGSGGDGGFPWVLQQLQRPGVVGHPDAAAAPDLPRSQVVIDHQTLNDLAVLGAGNPRPMQEAHRTKWSAIAASRVYEESAVAPSGPLVFTGTWTQFAMTTANSGAGIKFTSTVGDKVVFTVPSDYAGGVVSFIMTSFPAQDHTIGVRINGVDQPDARLQGSVLCDQTTANKFNAITLRFGRAAAGGAALSAFDYPATLAAGNTIELRLKTQTIAGSSMNFDSAHIEADPLDGPVIVVPRPNRCPTYAPWAGYPNGAAMNDAGIATWDAAIQAVGPEFPDRMVFVDIDTPLAKATANFLSDGIHPNAKGHGLIVQSVRDGLVASGRLTSRLFGRSLSEVQPYFVAPPTLNGWTDGHTGGFFTRLGYRRTRNGEIFVKGGVSKTTGSATDVIFQMPAGLRPTANIDRQIQIYNGAAYQSATVRIAANGNISIVSGGTIAASSVNFLNLSFTAEQ